MYDGLKNIANLMNYAISKMDVLCSKTQYEYAMRTLAINTLIGYLGHRIRINGIPKLNIFKSNTRLKWVPV